jgi:type III secretory pathway component EscU
MILATYFYFCLKRVESWGVKGIFLNFVCGKGLGEVVVVVVTGLQVVVMVLGLVVVVGFVAVGFVGAGFIFRVGDKWGGDYYKKILYECVSNMPIYNIDI